MPGTENYHIAIEFLDGVDCNTDILTSDYRFFPISVISVNNTMETGPGPSEPLRAILIGDGVIRLYRDFDDDLNVDADSIHKDDSSVDNTMLSIIALPTYFTATDLLGFIGDHNMEHISHIRLLRTEKLNRFLVLLKFHEAIKAAEFQYHYDGKPFNSMEPETCHVVFVKSVICSAADKSPANDNLIPFLLLDPFTSMSPSAHHELTSTPIELPTCPVCLEKLDHEITGLLTIPCQHTFHCLCLSKWRDDTCPICRYTNNLSNHRMRRSVRRLLNLNSRIQRQQQLESLLLLDAIPDQDANDSCMHCNVSENLWVCLICGNVGCGRYAPEQHSLKHFIESGHCFAMELSTSRVWDYAGDNYVHRLIANEVDGKIVELPDKDVGESKTPQKDADSAEYSELLLSQLISQREYYELLLNEKNPVGTSRFRRGSSFSEGKRLNELEEKMEDLTNMLTKLKSNVIPALNQKIELKDKSLKIAAKELAETNTLNEGLSARVDHLTEENKKLKEEKEDLSEQLRDVMFYLGAQEKFKDQPEDVKEGQVVMKPKANKKKGKGKK